MICNVKFQITNIKSQINSNDQYLNPNFDFNETVLGYCFFEFEIYL